MDKVVFSFLGTTLDNGFSSSRWQRWRPTISLGMQEDVIIKQLVLFYCVNQESDKAAREHRDLLHLIRQDLRAVSPETEVLPVALKIDDPWDFVSVYAALYEFAKAYEFTPQTTDYWVHITTGTHVAQICLFLLTEARYFPGKLLQTSPRRGAQAELGELTLIDLDLNQYKQLAARFESERQDDLAFLKFGIATRNAAFNQTIEEIEQVALRSRTPILLTGPTGAGKSFLARRIYELKKSRHQVSGQFVDVNCATLRGEGAMSALFGHHKGAFTGAQQARAGYLKAADQGLLFLDEIGELGLDEQAMLLKAIEEKRFFALGSDSETQSDFQLIVGTHRDLAQDVEAGRFREDLFARINTWMYRLPGLCDRREDLAPNIDWELNRLAQQFGQALRFTVEAQRCYLNYAEDPGTPWRGNFRDLSASLMRMATFAEQGKIDLQNAQREIQRLQQREPGSKSEQSINAADNPHWQAYAEKLDPFDWVQLRYVISVCQQSANLSEAGRHLYSRSRNSKKINNDADRLRKYLQKFELEFATLKLYPLHQDLR